MLESFPTNNYKIKQNASDPMRIEVVIDRDSSVSFAYNPETKSVIRTGISIHTSSLDISEEQFIGPSRLKNAANRAAKYFSEHPIVEKSDIPLGSQYELNLDDQTLH